MTYVHTMVAQRGDFHCISTLHLEHNEFSILDIPEIPKVLLQGGSVQWNMENGIHNSTLELNESTEQGFLVLSRSLTAEWKFHCVKNEVLI